MRLYSFCTVENSNVFIQINAHESVLIRWALVITVESERRNLLNPQKSSRFAFGKVPSTEICQNA